jgi:hypothetical protein
MFRVLIATCLSLSLGIATPAFAAAGGAKGENSAHGPRKQLSTIVLAGVAGAILGLSTLSFYGRPQDRLSNIAVGAAIGVIVGTVYTTFKAATEPHDFYGHQRDFAGHELWAMDDTQRVQPNNTPRWSTGFTF